MGNFLPEWYWSSTQLDQDHARSLIFGTGGPAIDLKGNLEFVRAARTFEE